MDALKIIPQVFFDLIGRMIPGLVAIFLGAFLLDNSANLENGIYQFSMNHATQVLSGCSIWLLLVAAYLMGHLISPLTKKIQRFNQWNQWKKKEEKKEREKEEEAAKLNKIAKESTEESPQNNSEEKKEDKKEKPVGFKKIVGNLFEIFAILGLFNWFKYIFYSYIRDNKKSKESKAKGFDSKKYEWLRIHSLEAGSHCAKLRAEFTMYNSIAAVFMGLGLFEIAKYFYNWYAKEAYSEGQLIAGAIFLVLFINMASRGEEGEETFQNGVNNFYWAAKGPDMPIK